MTRRYRKNRQITRSPKGTVPTHMEVLEPRQLLSATWAINGTPGADVILVTLDENTNQITVAVNDATSVRSAATVRKIVINSGKGDDTLTVNLGSRAIACVVNAGADNDTITVDVGAGRTPSVINGGAGNDTITGPDSATIVHGNAGDDVINGGAGYDRLYGDGGDDEIYGGGGDDKIFGGAGDDLLVGGAGGDRYSDASGHNTLYALHDVDITGKGRFNTIFHAEGVAAPVPTPTDAGTDPDPGTAPETGTVSTGGATGAGLTFTPPTGGVLSFTGSSGVINSGSILTAGGILNGSMSLTSAGYGSVTLNSGLGGSILWPQGGTLTSGTLGGGINILQPATANTLTGVSAGINVITSGNGNIVAIYPNNTISSVVNLGAGTVTITEGPLAGADIACDSPVVIAMPTSTLTLNGGTVLSAGAQPGLTLIKSSYGLIVVEGGVQTTVTAPVDDGTTQPQPTVPSGGVLTLSGGTLTARSGILSGGAITGSGTLTNGTGIAVNTTSTSTGVVNIGSGVLTISSPLICGGVSSGNNNWVTTGTVTLNGGTLLTTSSNLTGITITNPGYGYVVLNGGTQTLLTSSLVLGTTLPQSPAGVLAVG